MRRREFLGLAGAGVCGLAATNVFGAATPRHPNFVFIQGEAQGWTSMSVPMDDRVPNSVSDLFYTPNLARLARGGMRFSNFYAPSPRCTPSRASYLTGKSPTKLHMTFVNQRVGNTKLIPPKPVLEMPTKEMTIADYLKQMGYATAHFGKWHMGRKDPELHGFDQSDGANNNGGPENVRSPNPKQTYAIAKMGMTFMSQQVAAETPFYLQLDQYPGRGEQDALPKTLMEMQKRAKSRDDRRVGEAAANLDIDKTIGMVLDKLDELGIADNTYVIYTADHGTPGRSSNAPLTLGKGSVWEGGIRVPLLVRGPGIKSGTFAYERTTGVDLFPTIAELSKGDVSLPDGMEGGSLAPILMNQGAGKVKRSREELVFHFPHYDSDPSGPASAIILGDYKLIKFYETNRIHLFDLSKDIGEHNDLTSAEPKVAVQLHDRLNQYLKSVDAQMPRPNPNYDPNAPAAQNNRRRGRNRRRRNR
ncbi:MAG: sulfatase [bacterium]|nr:sulfatase [bacterium]